MSEEPRHPEHQSTRRLRARCFLTIALALLGPAILARSVGAQTPAQSSNVLVKVPSKKAAVIETMDGRSANTQIRLGQQKTTDVVIAEVNPPRISRTKVRLWLPEAVLDGQKGDYTLKLSSQNGVDDNLIIDPDGEWYRFTRYIELHKLTITIEGDAHLLPQSSVCKTLDDITTNIGSTEPQGRATAAWKGSHISLDEGDGATREFLFIRDCVAYRIGVECPAAKKDRPPKCSEALQKKLNGFDPRTRLSPVDDQAGDMRGVVAVDRLKTFNVPSLRALHSNRIARSIIEPSTRNNSADIEPFAFVEPGHAVYRQHLAPKDCTLAEPVKPTVHAVGSPFARTVFAPPALMQRFPIALKADQHAFANSQIFTRGGEFLLKQTPSGSENIQTESVTSLVARCKLESQTIVNKVGNRGDKINFTMPWSDTFCEWRGNSWHQAFCTKNGKATSGRHFGVDIRSTTDSINTLETVVSVSDGVIVEVSGEGVAKGHSVKVRSKHLVFVYRHMLPAHSPFRTRAPEIEARLQIGDRVAAGEVLGKVGNFIGTTKHLHFEIEAPLPKQILVGAACKVPRDDGKGDKRLCPARAKAPPYASLVVSYLAERYGKAISLDMIGGASVLPYLSGQEIRAKDVAWEGLKPIRRPQPMRQRHNREGTPSASAPETVHHTFVRLADR